MATDDDRHHPDVRDADDRRLADHGTSDHRAPAGVDHDHDRADHDDDGRWFGTDAVDPVVVHRDRRDPGDVHLDCGPRIQRHVLAVALDHRRQRQ